MTPSYEARLERARFDAGPDMERLSRLQFMRRLVHDLNNALSVITVNAGLLQSRNNGVNAIFIEFCRCVMPPNIQITSIFHEVPSQDGDIALTKLIELSCIIHEMIREDGVLGDDCILNRSIIIGIDKPCVDLLLVRTFFYILFASNYKDAKQYPDR